jgi:hypothetical protein
MSKFDRLFSVAKAEETEQKIGGKRTPRTTKVVSLAEAPQTSHTSDNKLHAHLTPVAEPGATEMAERPKVSGKRQHPDFVGLTTYIRKDVHRRVKIALLLEGNNRELSELVDELLAAWLEKNSA